MRINTATRRQWPYRLAMAMITMTQTTSITSEIKFDVKFVISNLNYHEIHVHISPNSLFGGLQMTLEVTSDLKFELSGLNNPCFSASLALYCFCELILPGREPIMIH